LDVSFADEVSFRCGYTNVGFAKIASERG